MNLQLTLLYPTEVFFKVILGLRPLCEIIAKSSIEVTGGPIIDERKEPGQNSLVLVIHGCCLAGFRIESTTMSSSNSTAKKIIFLTIFLDLVGFGIYITLGPYLARHFSASAVEIGWLMSIFSIMQFLFSPFWGRMSDRYGRRPILLMSLAGASLSYLGLAYAQSFTWLLVCRGLAGLFAANISTAHAYIADITTEKDRASGMGMIGAAFGLGFILGPSLGSLFGYIGNQLGSAPPLGLFFPAFMAFIITGFNLLWAYKSLPETHKGMSQEKNQPSQLQVLRSEPLKLTYLLAAMGIITCSMPLMEVMLFPFVDDMFGWGLKTAGLGFACVGLMMAFTQGYLVRKVVPRFGERKTLMAGVVLMTISFFMISQTTTIWWLAIAMSILAIGNGFMRPTMTAMISLSAKEENQGVVLGLTQSLSALARIFGPLIGGWCYDSVGRGSPFALAGCFTFLGFIVLILQYSGLPDQSKGLNSKETARG